MPELLTKFSLKKEETENEDDGQKIIFRWRLNEIVIGERLLMMVCNKEKTARAVLSEK